MKNERPASPRAALAPRAPAWTAAWAAAWRRALAAASTAAAVALLAVLLLAAGATSARAAVPLTRADAAQRARAEGLKRPYPQYVRYSELAGALARYARRAPDRVQILRQADSAGGHPLFLVVITAKMSARQRRINDLYRATLLSDPGYVLDHDWLRSGSGIRPAVFINASIHGDETTGMDASLRIVRRLALRNDPTTRRILNRLVVVVNPCQNPDGRISGARVNGNGFDLNRDFVELSQPETRQTVQNIRRWLPLSFDDLHGYVDPILIEPTTFPHNPNLEYDLLVRSTLHQAKYQSALNRRKTGAAAQIPYFWGTAADHTGSANEGWDDYAPYYTPQVAQRYGSIGQTIETPSKSATGVAQHFWVAWGSIRNCLDHRWTLARRQAELLARGDLGQSAETTGRPWAGNMTDMTRSVDPATGAVINIGWGDPRFPYSNLVGDVAFPYAYVIPVAPQMQQDPAAARRFVNHARRYGIEVDQATTAFVCDGVTYPAGTYVVRLAQPLRAFVNDLLWDGEDVRARYGVTCMYDVSVWSLPYMWGFDRTRAEAAFAAELAPVTSKQAALGAVNGLGPLYWFAGDSNVAVRAVNQMLARDYPVGMVTAPLPAPNDLIAAGSFVVDASSAQARAFLRQAARDNGIAFSTTEGLALTQTAVLGTGADRPRVRVAADAASRWALETVLGFDRVTVGHVDAGSHSDAFVNSSPDVAAAAVQEWLGGDAAPASGRRRTYIGITSDGTGGMLSSLIPGQHRDVDPDPACGDNGFCPVDFADGDTHTAGHPSTGFVFAYPAAWYDLEWPQPPGLHVDASYLEGSSGVYQSGFSSDPANTAAGVGKAAMLTYEPPGAAGHGRVVFMGFDPLYRAQTEGSYLLVARAILLSVATPPIAQ